MLALYPNPDVFLLNPEVRPGASLARAEDNESLGSGVDYELPTSKHSSCDDKASEELLEVVTHVVAKLQLDWPR